MLAHPDLGFAGTADLLAVHHQFGMMLVDYKTQGVKPGQSPRAYPAWCSQLAAYRLALGVSEVGCMNVIVNSAEPGDLVERVWTEEELAEGLEMFEAAAVLWRCINRFDPRSGAPRRVEVGV